MVKKKSTKVDDSFLPRRERVKKIVVPQNTLGCLIVKPNEEGCIIFLEDKKYKQLIGLGFRLNCFDNEILGDRVTEKRFRETVFNCSKICQTVWSKKRLVEERDPMEEAKRKVLFSSQFLIYGIILFLLGAYVEDFSQQTRDILGILGCIFFAFQTIIAVWIVGEQIMRQDIVMINLEVECRKQLKAYLGEENEFYNHQGLNWVIGKDFFWLELYLMMGK